MDLFLNIIKGFLVGVAASIPVGPVAILVIQKSLSKGYKAGFVTGLGASVVDTLFAVIAVFALAFTQKFLSDHEVVILLAGGVILIGLGLAMTLKNPFRKMKADGTYTRKDFLHEAAKTIPGVYVPSFYRHEYNEDGTISIPVVLQPYMGGKAKLTPKK